MRIYILSIYALNLRADSFMCHEVNSVGSLCNPAVLCVTTCQQISVGISY